MSIFEQFDPLKQPKGKVELHVHLDGSVRLTTIWELAQKKGIPLGVKSLDELFAKCNCNEPCTLHRFLKGFEITAPVLCGDLDAIERVAYEFCEDSAKQGVLYSEPRYCPHLLCSSSKAGGDVITPTNVVESVNEGFRRGQADYQIKIRSILCCFRTRPEWSPEILDLCVKFKNQGVVGIDISGDEAQEMANPETIAVFQKAAALGIHRTAHAGEAGPAVNVALAVKEMMAERIGHGYHAVEDKDIYRACLRLGIHFETCPYSSYLTGSVPLSTPKHPIIRFAEDVANFSISRDDPFIIQKTLEQDYSLLRQLGMRDVHFARANFNAAASCFLPEDEKKELLETLQQIYGMKNSPSSDGFCVISDEESYVTLSNSISCTTI